ncbi:hypothetical protein BDD43_3399 [Mucilaginibacter gracilis]|uniref:Uncharacterized protein n=1 Tax=Mucilaginibacter gracilis TaxID=423350 RepID=A0A495J2N3_9SPHI|nr:hypothetical protein [Mucilaginibacter gracilis]RKR83197.1 hypothetical protein BDD43_3399 [Mucilaginibacter gracilis]
MAKKKERSIARNYYVDLGKTAKEIAELIDVSEQTLSKWINDPEENWKEQRNAKVSNAEVGVENINQLINGLCEDRINLAAQLKKAESELEKTTDIVEKNLIVNTIQQIRKNLASIDNGVIMWNKTRSGLQKESKISFPEYMKVMEEIFMALRLWNEKFYLQTIDFQEQHLNKVASRYN